MSSTWFSQLDDMKKILANMQAEIKKPFVIFPAKILQTSEKKVSENTVVVTVDNINKAATVVSSSTEKKKRMLTRWRKLYH